MTTRDAVDKAMTELLVATGDLRERGIDSAMNRLLKLMREELQMDVAFVSEFVGGERVMRYVDVGPRAEAIAPGLSHPMDATLCQRVIDGRLPQVVPDLLALRETVDLPVFDIEIRAHLSVPVQRHDGRIYGTLCCFSLNPDPSVGERHLRRLEMSAKLAGRLLDEADGVATPPTSPD
ncbi:GAF domain-containing protein [Variovorax sp. PAMC 28711]|uniref:GAF domain-containing protein n=1 Tax=Variovorax sp. PAMC 28711 TaxID=1795631 RepID=UPI00078BC6B8|nr:GAF domain-containing protein [Variovorax sp. PAMC 28711]AMM23322.1 hypothetical protein AX767_02300 [Variovorax sp. PAMC 28711]